MQKYFCHLNGRNFSRVIIRVKHATDGTVLVALHTAHSTCFAEGDVEWKPARPGWQTAPPNRKKAVPSLSRLCILTVADCIDYVESLYGLPQVYLVRYCLTPSQPIPKLNLGLQLALSTLGLTIGRCSAFENSLRF